MKKQSTGRTTFFTLLSMLLGVAFLAACAYAEPVHHNPGAGGGGGAAGGGGAYQTQMNAAHAVRTKASQDYDCPVNEITLQLIERGENQFKYNAGVCGFPMTFVAHCQDAATCEASLDM